MQNDRPFVNNVFYGLTSEKSGVHFYAQEKKNSFPKPLQTPQTPFKPPVDGFFTLEGSEINISHNIPYMSSSMVLNRLGR